MPTTFSPPLERLYRQAFAMTVEYRQIKQRRDKACAEWNRLSQIPVGPVFFATTEERNAAFNILDGLNVQMSRAEKIKQVAYNKFSIAFHEELFGRE